MAELFNTKRPAITKYLSNIYTNQGLVSTEAEAVARVISDYARSWSLLQGYDEKQLTELNIKQPDMQSLGLEEGLKALGELKHTLIAKGEATELFGAIRHKYVGL